jgi:hypothetical protein
MVSDAQAAPLPGRRWSSPPPLIRQPLADLADRRGRQVRQQLSQVALGINVVPAARAGQTAEDRGGLLHRISAPPSLLQWRPLQPFLLDQF